MPLVDMPLEELRSYKGRNPRPDDFDAYWERALGEMKAIDADMRLDRAAFQTPLVECFDLTFTGVDGARVYAKCLRPAGDAPAGGRPAMVQFHGYTCDSGEWANYLSWAMAGFVVVSLDCRGQGGRSEDVGGVRGNTQSGHIIRGLEDSEEKLLFRSIFLDAAQLAGLVMDMDDVDSTRVMARGGSQGGALTLACAALEPRVARIALVYPFLSDYQRVWEMDMVDGAYHELKQFFRLRDPKHEREAEWFRRLGYIDVQHLAPRIKARTLMACGLMDRTCPPSTQFAAYNKITAEKDVVVYPDFGHEHLPGFEDATFSFLTKE
ncbi:MAG: acetylxylan esterase [Algisphaera sp.]